MLFRSIQGEDFTYRNNSSIRAVAEIDVNVSPRNLKESVLNTVDEASFDDAGLKLSYEFDVTTAGYYYVALNYLQSNKSDFPVFVDVSLCIF